MSVELGKRIKSIREYRNYTQNHLAEKLNISQNTYSKLESGATKITTERLMELAKVLDVPVETLINTDRQIFNLENNRIDNFYGYIEHLHSENKELLQLLRQQNEALLKAFEAFTNKMK